MAIPCHTPMDFCPIQDPQDDWDQKQGSGSAGGSYGEQKKRFDKWQFAHCAEMCSFSVKKIVSK
jgi:hypothetical protein